MKELEQESAFYRYNLVLPDRPSSLTQREKLNIKHKKEKNSENEEKETEINETQKSGIAKDKNSLQFRQSVINVQYIPESRISQRLRQSLITLKKQQTTNTDNMQTSNININDGCPNANGKPTNSGGNCGHSFDTRNNSRDTKAGENANNTENVQLETKQVNSISVKMCEEIITCFESLYRKYIDSSGAIFEINISSSQRQDLTELFDSQYYRRMINSNKNNKDKKFVIDSYKNDNLNMSMIKQELNDFVAQQQEQNEEEEEEEIDESELIKFLLKKIIIKMEASAREMSSLMHNSFVRFVNQRASK